jgi:hypothetical protein
MSCLGSTFFNACSKLPDNPINTCTLTLLVTGGETTEEVYVKVDDNSVAACYSTFAGTTHELGSTSVNVHLRVGQRVHITLLQDAEHVRGYVWNTFSGALISPDI